MTTMASSITRPAATDSAPRVRMFRLMFRVLIRVNATRSDSGMDTPATRVLRTERRKSRIMATAKRPPMAASRARSLTELRIVGAWLATSRMDTPAGGGLPASTSRTASSVATVLAPCSLTISNPMEGRPSVRLMVLPLLASVRVTTATSPRVRPGPTGTAFTSSRLSRVEETRTGNWVPSTATPPTGTERLAAARAWDTRAGLSPASARRTGSTTTATNWLEPPVLVTPATPAVARRAGSSRVST